MHIYKIIPFLKPVTYLMKYLINNSLNFTQVQHYKSIKFSFKSTRTSLKINVTYFNSLTIAE